MRLLLMTFLTLRLLGGDTAVLQGVAWLGMIVSRAPAQGVAAAVDSSLDGSSPCALCKAVREIKAASQPSPQTEHPLPETPLKRLKFQEIVPVNAALPGPPSQNPEATANRFKEDSAAGPSRKDSPPVPPPRQHPV